MKGAERAGLLLSMSKTLIALSKDTNRTAVILQEIESILRNCINALNYEKKYVDVDFSPEDFNKDLQVARSLQDLENVQEELSKKLIGFINSMGRYDLDGHRCIDKRTNQETSTTVRILVKDKNITIHVEDLFKVVELIELPHSKYLEKSLAKEVICIVDKYVAISSDDALEIMSAITFAMQGNKNNE